MSDTHCKRVLGFTTTQNNRIEKRFIRKNEHSFVPSILREKKIELISNFFYLEFDPSSG